MYFVRVGVSKMIFMNCYDVVDKSSYNTAS